MYLVSDTVEESIYDISVTRRLSHIAQKEKEKEAQSVTPAHDDKITVEDITQTAIDSANSIEMQNAALGKLMMGGPSGGELVGKDDVWQCLFGAAARKGSPGTSRNAEQEVGRFLRGQAAEDRRAAAGSL